MLNINKISYHVGGRTILENASGRVPAGQRVGLVGGNGSGKTTLLKIITGVLEQDSGSVDIRKKCSVGTVAQEAPSGSRTPLETVLQHDIERNKLLEESETAKDPHRISYIHERLADIDAYSAPARAAVILSGLGFSESDQKRALSEFSGGWKMRVALAGALFARPDLLLLDEPTNHLDLESIMWLEGYLVQYPKTLLLVSHDRDLLNGVAQNILLVKDAKLTFFSGNYDSFIRTQTEREAMEDAVAAKQEAKRAHLQSFVDRFRAKATKAKQAQSRLKALQKMSAVSKTLSSSGSNITFNFPDPLSNPSPLITMNAVSAGYESDKPILKDINLSVYSGDRIALLGANGNGKSTMARILAGELTPFTGHTVKTQKLNVGYFAQDHLEQLVPDITPLEQVSRQIDNGNSESARNWLGRFGLGQERSEVVIKYLSGGEKTRLALSLVALKKPNLMILDEPTNHLDMDSRAALVDGLNSFNGTLILISHDRNLVETTCDQLWLVQNGACVQYFEDMQTYKTMLLASRSSRSISSKEDEGVKKVAKKQSRQDAAKIRSKLAPLKKRATQAEKTLETATIEKDNINMELLKPEIYEGSPDKVIKLTARLAKLDQIIEESESEWMEALEELEDAEKQLK